ncbi:hypothetical protein [Clostridium transplantifaecale]|nr:hypothetical protein [Clostridium transplantifaecale]
MDKIWDILFRLVEIARGDAICIAACYCMMITVLYIIGNRFM